MNFESRYKQPWSAAKMRSRFWSKVDKQDDCWEWTAGRDRDGYGLFAFPWGQWRAHRVAYELEVGEIPEGLQLDHTCRNRGCVNPAHLEPVTCRENIMRSPVSIASINAAKTECSRGHKFEGSNVIAEGTGRHCRACRQMLKAGDG